MARICIVTPGQLGSNPRVVKEATALAEAGHAVTVIATRVMAAVEPRDQAVLASAAYTVRRIVFGNGWLWRFERLRQMVARRLFALLPSPRVAAIAISPMAPQLRRAAMAERADLYIAHYPPALPAVAAAAATARTKFAFDAEDFHAGERAAGLEQALDNRIIAALERRFLPAAAHVTAGSPGIAQAYAEAYRIDPPTVVLNSFPRDRAGPCPPELVEPDRPARIYWFSQVIGPGRGLEPLVEAIARSRFRPSLALRGMIGDAYRAGLHALAQRSGVADRLELLDPLEPDRLEADGAAYDIGYVGELAETHNRQIALTNKLFSYLSSGLAVLASDISAHRTIAPEFGHAIKLFPTGDAAGLAARLDEWLADRAALQAARRAAWALGQQRFAWERDKAALLARIEASLA